MGLNLSYQLGEMLESIITRLSSLNKPLIIIDEFDELDNRALRVFKDLYNRCSCGFVLVGGRYFEERFKKGINKTKQSYQEIYSRLGGEFLLLKPVNKSTVESICRANGVRDNEQIEVIFKQSGDDLRRVKAFIEAVLLTSKN
jgi:DNA transposition AAA+ family ATPase